MKKTKLSLILCGLMIATVLFISSCQKKTTTTTTPPDTNTNSATDNNTSEGASKDLMNIGSESIDNGSLSTYRLGGGLLSPLSGSVIISPWPPTSKQISVTFTNFVGRDGNTRNGTVLYDWSTSTNNANYFKDSGLVLNVSTPNHDYTVGNASSGTFTIDIVSKQVKNLGRVTAGTYGSSYNCFTWSDASNINITKPSGGGTINWTCNRNMILINTAAIMYAGSSIPASYTPGQFINWVGAVIGFTGNASGTNSGTSYTANITSRVEYNFNCSPVSGFVFFHPPVAGSIDFTPSGKPTRTINYGTGVCDDTYTVTIGTWIGTFSFI